MSQKGTRLDWNWWNKLTDNFSWYLVMWSRLSYLNWNTHIYKVSTFKNSFLLWTFGASLVVQTVNNLPAMQETWVWSLGQEDPLEKGKATHSNILAWRTPWTEEPGGLQPTGSQRVGHDWATNPFTRAINIFTIFLSLWTFSFGVKNQENRHIGVNCEALSKYMV